NGTQVAEKVVAMMLSTMRGACLVEIIIKAAFEVQPLLCGATKLVVPLHGSQHAILSLRKDREKSSLHKGVAAPSLADESRKRISLHTDQDKLVFLQSDSEAAEQESSKGDVFPVAPDQLTCPSGCQGRWHKWTCAQQELNQVSGTYVCAQWEHDATGGSYCVRMSNWRIACPTPPPTTTTTPPPTITTPPLPG
ncbi:unnamed protein product, partial [Amoebophrya sp. A25]